jgi:fructokinase
VLWDMFPSGKKLGGAPTNFAYHTKALAGENASAMIASSVGDDQLGREIWSILESQSLCCEAIAIDGEKEYRKYKQHFLSNGEV